MRKLLVLGALLVAGVVQADFHWSGTGIIFGHPGDASWSTADSWGNTATGNGGAVPDASAPVIIQRYIWGTEGIPGQAWDSGVSPVLDTAASVGDLYLGLSAASGVVQTAQLDLVSGANLTAINLLAARTTNCTAELNLSGNAEMTVGAFHTPIGGSIAFNLNDSSELTINALTSIDDWHIVIDSNAVVTIDTPAGEHLAVAGLITAKRPIDTILTTNLSGNVWQYTVVAGILDTYDWLGTSTIYDPDGEDDSWSKTNNWRSRDTGARELPGPGDTVLIQRYVQGNEGIPSGAWDSGISAELDVVTTTLGDVYLVQSAELGVVQTAQLDMIGGAYLPAANLVMAPITGSTATLNMSSNAAVSVNGLFLGVDDGTSASTIRINMSDTSFLNVLLDTVVNSTGVDLLVTMGDNSVLRLASGDLAWANTAIIAGNAAGGESILATDVGDGVVEYTVLLALPAPEVWIDSQNLYWTSVAGMQYSISNTTDLAAGSWAEWTNGIAATPGTNSIPLPLDTYNPAFFKVNVY